MGGRGKEGKGRERGRGEHITCWLCLALLQLPTVVFNISKCVFLGKQCVRSKNQSRRRVLENILQKYDDIHLRGSCQRWFDQDVQNMTTTLLAFLLFIYSGVLSSSPTYNEM